MATEWMNAGMAELMTSGATGKTFDAILVNATDTLDQSGNRFISDISANELSATGYARVALTNVTITESQNSHALVFSSDDITFPLVGAGQTAAAAYIAIRHADGDSASKLVIRIDDTNVLTSGGDIIIEPDASNGFGYIDG